MGASRLRNVEDPFDTYEFELYGQLYDVEIARVGDCRYVVIGNAVDRRQG